MKKTLLALCATMAMTSFPALANLYKEGTELHGYVAQLDQYLPEQVEVFFINRTEPTALLAQINPEKVTDVETQNLITKAMDYNKGYKGVNYYVFSKTFRASKDEDARSVCAIYTLDMKKLETSFMHEMMHCAAMVNSEVYGKNGLDSIFRPLMSKQFTDSNGRVVDAMLKIDQLAEVHAHVMAEVIEQKTGLTLDHVNKALRLAGVYPISAAKTATARGVEICRAMECPSDPSDLAKVLVNDKAFVEALRHDLSVANDYEAKARN